MTDSPELHVISRDPLNAETRLADLVGIVTPVGRHYVRNHFPIPAHPGTLTIAGAVRRPLTLTLAELEARRTVTHHVTLECAGNGRSYLDPMPPGEPWGLGAVGTAEWTGVRLGELLADAGLAPEVVEIRSRGSDQGRAGGLERPIAFERSLPPDVARGALVAFAMNGRPLTPNHGAPLRLVVRGWYGMAAVKWLTEITATTEPFRGFFQVERYVVDGKPLGRIAPRAVIVAPADGATVAAGRQLVRGLAWSGLGIVRVEVSLDRGASWRRARLGPRLSSQAWRSWEFEWRPSAPGEAVLLARAVDADGRLQPLEPVRDPLGYVNNAAQPTRVQVQFPARRRRVRVSSGSDRPAF
jgi:DMSO/TMAO reductase YedYZ molybdopterin-dependent catalytic subunit